MSSYVTFWIKNQKHNIYTELDAFSRNTSLYRAFDYVLGSNVDEDYNAKVLSVYQLQEIFNCLEADKASYTDSLTQLELLILDIGSWQNTIDEKLNKYGELNMQKQEILDEIKEIENAQNTVGVFISIADNNFEYSNETIYGGIECGAPDSVQEGEIN